MIPAKTVATMPVLRMPLFVIVISSLSVSGQHTQTGPQNKQSVPGTSLAPACGDSR
jgi:hypothetical protein